MTTPPIDPSPKNNPNVDPQPSETDALEAPTIPPSDPVSEAPTLDPHTAHTEAPTIPPAAHASSEDATLPPTEPASSSGPKLGEHVRYFGDYELLEEIARGGMGVVYKARQTKLNRLVALKMILAGQLAGEADVKRFYVEAEAAANLNHPGIVPIYEIGEHEGQHYFSMAYIDGESLAAKVADGPLPPEQAAKLTQKISEAIGYAHSSMSCRIGKDARESFKIFIGEPRRAVGMNNPMVIGKFSRPVRAIGRFACGVKRCNLPTKSK